ncbi:uncharacterized protein conserved in bacteria [Longilinea arvoryzae]|uniref:Uncharacterized protein conserved in bacteria n=1 Tax=Longilinea arvoryzae TaxID=360412 RepID=A0A0K8MY48_9CHLR|nr:DUF1801 domain-containing protein [Longilinea arvoryzae]GAP16130.1 uncharacterized protein conserved in bacteria [Longilinea arvoryzae]
MTTHPTHPKVDQYIQNANKWREALETLRPILLDSPLTEEFKWGVPCYTIDRANVVLMHVFKEYCALLFFKGALLKDSLGILVQQTQNVQASRQIRFTAAEQIAELEPVLKAYIQEAIDVEKAGLKVNFKATAEFSMPDELRVKFAADPAFEAAFQALTPGRQRAYLLYFSAPKQSQTRSSRIEKCLPQILAGKGLND